MNQKSPKKNLLASTFGATALLLLGVSESFAAPGEYEGSEFWYIGDTKNWGNSWAGASYSYGNLAETWHEGLTTSFADQAVVTRTEVTVKARAYQKSVVLMQAFANGEGRGYHNGGTDFYRARGSVILFDKEFLNANYYDYESGSATLSYSKSVEKTVSGEGEFYGIPIKGSVTGTVTGSVNAEGHRRAATSSSSGYERATSSLGISVKATGKLSAPGTSVTVQLIGFAVTPEAYSYRDVDPNRSASDRVRYRLGIDSPLTVSGGGGKWEVVGETVFDWDGWSSSKSYGKHDHDERFASVWH